MSILQRIKNITLFKSREIHSVEINTNEKELFYRSVRLKNNYGRVTLRSYEEVFVPFLENIARIQRKPQLPFWNNLPLTICFTGKQVILRKLSLENSTLEDALLLQKILPGAKMSEFHLQRRQMGDNLWVGAMKLSIINEVVSAFNEAKFQVIHLTLGPMDATLFFDIIPNCDSVTVSGYVIDKNTLDVSISDERESNKVIQIGATQVPQAVLVPFASGITTFQNASAEEMLPEIIIKNKEEVTFGLYQLALLRTFFLLVGFMIGTSYFVNENYQIAIVDLQDTTAEQNHSYQLYQLKQTEYNEKVAILSATGVISSKKVTMIGDRLGSTLPESIRLIDLQIFPLNKKIKKDKKIEFDKNLVKLQGVSNSSITLNDWIKELSDEFWVGEVTILNYSQTDKQNPGIFELEIVVRA